MYNLLPFQKEAVDKMLQSFLSLWTTPERQLPLVLKSPTGSGKTLTTANFVQSLNHLPNWNMEKAFIFITFSDDLAMQNKEKFKEYFDNNLENGLLTVNDLSNGKLFKNDILFLNWQKVVSRSAESRVLRRPDDDRSYKESGVYFEDFIDNTHKDKREIILIIDEAHKNKSTQLAQNIIDYIDPKIIIHVTATPKVEDIAKAATYNSFIQVNREKVVKAGLIKDKIMAQTDEDLKKFKDKDLDEVLLELGINKRKEVKEEYKKIGKKINPLMLIQLPNDDRELRDRGEKTKEEIVLSYLENNDVDKKNIALWFDDHKDNLEYITDNESPVDYMLFKQAAGTGWDCPRAHILVMFREINSPTFYLQTLGRILRMAEPYKIEDYTNNPILKTGYLYTNYRREDVNKEWDKSDIKKPNIFYAKRKQEISQIEIQSDFVSRLEYGDLANSVAFQESFFYSMNKYFDIDINSIFGQAEKKLKEKGVIFDLSVQNKIIANAKFENVDDIGFDFINNGVDLETDMSVNDIEKTFNYLCFKLLKEQDDEDSKISNISRSWSPLKSALRVWFRQYVSSESRDFYSLFINDIYREQESVFRPAITQAIKEYKPVLAKIIEERREEIESRSGTIFTIRDEYGFSEDFEEVNVKLCAISPCYFQKEYLGKINESKFREYIDNKEELIEWWFKNGDMGQEFFSIKYFSSKEKAYRLFYPDWIIRFKNGKTGIFDTKSGDTAKSDDTIDKARALYEKIKTLGNKFVGGIVIPRNGVWRYHEGNAYSYDGKTLDVNWKNMETLFSS